MLSYVKFFDVLGVETAQIPCIELQGAPTAATEGVVGLLGMDVTSESYELYKCVKVEGSVYTWKSITRGEDGTCLIKAEVDINGDLVLTLSNGTTINVGKVRGEKGETGAKGIDGIDGVDGVAVKGVNINEDGELIVTLSNDNTINAGRVKGDQGVSITKTELNTNYELVITLSNGTTINVGNIRGEQGIQGPQGEQGIQGIQGKRAIVVTNAEFNTITDTITVGKAYQLKNVTYNRLPTDEGEAFTGIVTHNSIKYFVSGTVTSLISTYWNVEFETVTPIRGEKGDQGEKGEKGEKGEDGKGASITVDSKWIEGSTNPVESKLIQAELAKIPFVDSAISSTSKNPVQNKVIYEALEELRNDLSIAFTQSGVSFGETTFTYVISNELTNGDKEVESVSTSFNTGKVQRYSRDGEIVEVQLKKIAFDVLGEFKTEGAIWDKWLYVYDSSGNEIHNEMLLFKSGTLQINKSISVTKNTTLVFKLEACVKHNNTDGTVTKKQNISLTNSVTISFPVFCGVTQGPELPEDIKSANFTHLLAPTLKGYTHTRMISATRFIWYLTTEDVIITCEGFNAGFQLCGTKMIGEVPFNCYRSASAIIPGAYNFKFN